MLALSAPNFVLLQGVIIGLGYGLLAVGLVLIYRTNRVLNFAQGQVGVIAAVFLVKLTADFKFEYWFALVLSISLAAAVGGAVRARAPPPVQPAPRARDGGHHRPEPGPPGADRAARSSGPTTSTSRCRSPSTSRSPSGSTIFTPGEVLTLIVAPIVAVALALAVRSTSWGLNMRAMSENADSARLSGVWIRRTSTLTWTVAGALSAFTAILNAPGQTSALTQVAEPRPAALRAHRRTGRRHDQPDGGLRRRHRRRGALRAVAVEHLLHGQPATGPVHRAARRAGDPGPGAAQGQPLGGALDLAARRHHGAGHRRRAAPADFGVGHVGGRRRRGRSCRSCSTSGTTICSARSASMR